MKHIVTTLTAGALLALLPQSVHAQPKGGKTWDHAVDQAITYLKSTQSAEGTWGTGPVTTGMTGIVVTSLLKTGKVGPDDPAIVKALKYIESLVDEKEGHIAGLNVKSVQANYPTCVNLMALAAADPEGKKYKAIINKAAAFLKKLQWDEGEGKKPDDVIYGGAGYGGGTRPDLSNTHFFIDALVAAGVTKDDPAFKKAVVFISRCQNLKSEFQDQPWGSKINDGSFIYTASGETRGDPGNEGARPGYGSMTYAGIKCLLLCGIGRDDLRLKKALEWIGKNYTVDINPGMPEGSGARGYYYYLAVQAKCLSTLGDEIFVDANGKKHEWRKDISTALLNRQKKNGSWANDIENWMEGNPDLCTAYALMTLSYAKSKAK